MTGAALPLSRVVHRSEVPEQGLPVEVVAGPDDLAALAGFLDIPAVEAFRAEMLVERWRGDGLVVRGLVEARVVQTCVVTLEPAPGDVVERFEVFLAPDPEAPQSGTMPDHAPDPDDVEPLVGQRIDVATLALEHLVLGLDPYPRREGVAFEMAGDRDGDERAHPFAALEALRGRGKRG